MIIAAGNQIPITRDPFGEPTDRALAPKDGLRPYASYYLNRSLRILKSPLYPITTGMLAYQLSPNPKRLGRAAGCPTTLLQTLTITQRSTRGVLGTGKI